MAVSDATGDTAEAVRPVALPAPRGRAGFGGTLRSEFTKIRSTRSTYWTLLALMVITIAFGAVFSFGSAQHPDAIGPDFEPAARSLAGTLPYVFSAWTGFGVFALYAAIALTGGMVAFRRRDA